MKAMISGCRGRAPPRRKLSLLSVSPHPPVVECSPPSRLGSAHAACCWSRCGTPHRSRPAPPSVAGSRLQSPRGVPRRCRQPSTSGTDLDAHAVVVTLVSSHLDLFFAACCALPASKETGTKRWVIRVSSHATHRGFSRKQLGLKCHIQSYVKAFLTGDLSVCEPVSGVIFQKLNSQSSGTKPQASRLGGDFE